MVTAQDMLSRWEAVNPTAIATAAINQTAQSAAELNRIQLFQLGEKADGTRLKPYKNKRYARFKALMNLRTADGIPDFKLSGDLYEKIAVEAEGGKVVFNSTSEHGAFMEARDGAAIFGLNDESKADYSAITAPVMIEKLKNQTGCK